MMMRDLTSRQRDILNMIRGHIEEFGYPPTVREIGEACGLKSPRSVSQHLDTLERRGYIRRKKDKSRAIEVMGTGRDVSLHHPLVSLPLVGTIPAGSPAVAAEEWEAVYAIDETLFGDSDAFLLRARGDSMTGAHIMDGDLLVIQPSKTAEDGEIVAALIGDDATVKRLVRSGKDLYLVPAHDEMEPIRLDPRDGSVRIVGRVAGLIRRMR
jgi:repressor LexA